MTSNMSAAQLLYPWHLSTIEHVTDLAGQGILPNAIALTSAPGWGHNQLLEILSRVLLDLPSPLNVSEDQHGKSVDENGTEFQPIEELAHPDFCWIEPDGASIKIEQIRRINEFAVRTRQIASRKVAAISDAHLLNANSSNALLKTLEEPPGNTHILLATPYWGKLSATIRSRCQRIQIPLDQSMAMQWLTAQNIDIDEKNYAVAGNAPLHALELSEHAITDVTRWLLQASYGFSITSSR